MDVLKAEADGRERALLKVYVPWVSIPEAPGWGARHSVDSLRFAISSKV